MFAKDRLSFRCSHRPQVTKFHELAGDPCGSRVRTGGPDLLENQKAIGYLSNTGPDPMENHKATKSAFNVGPPSAIKWRFAGEQMVAHQMDPLSHSSTTKNRQSLGGPPVTKRDLYKTIVINVPFLYKEG